MSENQNENVFLPTGDYLRQLIGQSEVTGALTKRLGRRRGCFSSDSSKDTIGSVLIGTGMSPIEIVELAEFYIEKEAKEKYITRSIDWEDTDLKLTDVLDMNDLSLENLFVGSFDTLNFSKAPRLEMVGKSGDAAVIKFEIERNSPTKNWGASTTNHPGRIELKLDREEKQLRIGITHTSSETKSVAGNLSNRAIKQLKDKSWIPKDAAIVSIKFSDFTNQKRISFLSEVCRPASSLLEFDDTKDITFCSDSTVANHPSELAWMTNRIEILKAKGQDLHSTFFIKDAQFHPFLKVFGIECSYTVQGKNYSGTCQLRFEFHARQKSKIDESELVFEIISTKLDTKGVPNSEVEAAISKEIELHKMSVYKKHKT